MSRVVVRPPFLLHPEELPVPPVVHAADPLASTADGRTTARVNALLIETLSAGTEYPDELKARVREATTMEELEAVLHAIVRWRESRRT